MWKIVHWWRAPVVSIFVPLNVPTQTPEAITAQLHFNSLALGNEFSEQNPMNVGRVRLLTSHCSKHNLWKLTNHMEDHGHTENIETLKFNDDSQQFLDVFCCLIIPIFLKCWNEYYCKLLIFSTEMFGQQITFQLCWSSEALYTDVSVRSVVTTAADGVEAKALKA